MNELYRGLLDGKERLSLIGMGYVGLPIAVAFSKRVKVTGFDINLAKVELLKSGVDPTGEVGDEALSACGVDFTSDPASLRDCRFHVVAVPTPINADHTPDLVPLESASRILGRNLAPGSVVVYESTVYPGLTEEVCVPILERESGLVCGPDFKIGYSPERINPGDKLHRLENIVKIVSGMDGDTLDLIADVYGLVVEAGVFKAESIKVAEAAKVIENSQRDINIAFMNELSVIFQRMGIDTRAVLEAAGTKWNFLKFSPGLVGGHCIGVDPYYLTYKASQMGYDSQVILAGRRINDNMGKYVAENIVKALMRRGVYDPKIVIFGLTFKENCPDIRNTRVVDIICELRGYGLEPSICDPVADPGEVLREYGIPLVPPEEVRGADALVFAVAHDCFAAIDPAELDGFFRHDALNRLIFDVKGIFDKQVLEGLSYTYWRL